MSKINHSQIESGIRLVLKGLNCDLRDRNYLETPERFARAMEEMFSQAETEYTTFEEKYSDFIMLRGHKMWSLCPHHLFPVAFEVDLAYIPNGEVLGLSKLARMLEEVNSGPLLQEKFTCDVVLKMDEIVANHGVACRIVGKHGCAQMRGIKTSAEFLSYNFSGEFKNNPAFEQRFFELVRRG